LIRRGFGTQALIFATRVFAAILAGAPSSFELTQPGRARVVFGVLQMHLIYQSRACGQGNCEMGGWVILKLRKAAIWDDRAFLGSALPLAAWRDSCWHLSVYVMWSRDTTKNNSDQFRYMANSYLLHKPDDLLEVPKEGPEYDGLGQGHAQVEAIFI